MTQLDRTTSHTQKKYWLIYYSVFDEARQVPYPSVMTADCDETGCTFECLDVTLVPNTISITCNANAKEYINEFNIDVRG